MGSSQQDWQEMEKRGRCKCKAVLPSDGERVVCHMCVREYDLFNGVWKMRESDGRLITNPAPRR